MAITNSDRFFPAVSVIIPLYNSEKYIDECLKSVLAQTFKNFEVIVVDDCSTDNSVAIVESYAEKFDGRLKLSRMSKNSGRPSLPRNKGLAISRGEYIYFMDNDDLITKTALEELYGLAKAHDADVVCCERYYVCGEKTEKLKLTTIQKGTFVDKPTVETEDSVVRLKKILKQAFMVMPWNYLIKRDLLIENEISFPDIIRDDSIWSWHLVLSAKKILRVPNAVYVWRNVKDSITRVEKTPQQEIAFWLNPVILGVKALHETLNRLDLFRNNSQYRYAMMSHFVKGSFSSPSLFRSSFKLKPFEFYETVREKFSDNFGEQDLLIPLLCTIINANQKIFAVNKQEFVSFLNQGQEKISELKKSLEQAQKRIDELEAQLKAK